MLPAAGAGCAKAAFGTIVPYSVTLQTNRTNFRMCFIADSPADASRISLFKHTGQEMSAKK